MQVLVLGMHRSGTSIVARLLNMMGAYFAPEGTSLGANQENPKGFWERRDVWTLNDMVLHSVAADWHRLSDFALEKIPAATVAQFKTEAGKIILAMDAHRPWFLKDPRFCLLAPFWLGLLEVPVCIMVNRSPIEVARSLEMRNGFSIAVGLALWERYNIAALNATRGRRRIQVNHADLMADPVATVRQLHQNLEELDVRGLREPSDEEIRAFIDPSVYRAKERQVRGRLSPAQRKLRRAFQSGRILLLEKAIHFSAESQEVLSQHDRWMEAQDKIAEHEKAFAQTQKELEQAIVSAAAHRNMLEKSEKEKSELKNQISLQAAAIARDQRRIEKLRELLSKAGKLLERVLTSSRWRIGSLVLFRSRRFAGELDPRWRRRLLGEYKTWIQQGGEYSTTDPAKSHSTSISKTDGSGGPGVEKKLNPSLAFRADPSAGRKGGERGGQSISIVIPVYNGYDDLIRCLESVQRHSRPNHPVIVIDDSPDERIWPWLQRWATQHQNFRVVRNKLESWLHRDRNRGCELAGPGDIILLNSDTIGPPDWIEQVSACD